MGAAGAHHLRSPVIVLGLRQPNKERKRRYLKFQGTLKFMLVEITNHKL